jgi:hypothetical protein
MLKLSLKSLATSFLALTLLAGPGLAQTACDPAKLAAAVDRYAADPFSALNWRVLKGLGDPMIAASEAGGDSWTAKERWRKLSAEIMPDSQDLQSLGWNCRIGYPLSVLEKRIDALGKDHPYVKQWLLVQEQVMRACASEQGEVAMPPPLEPEAAFANRQAMDRAYQEASIAFYRDRDKAIPMFRAIAQSNSQHRAAARYNVANLLANAKQPEAARQEADTILADPSLASVHSITRELLGYIANQEDTAAGWTRLIDGAVATLDMPADKILASEDLRREYATALTDIDFIGIREKDDDWWLDGTLPENPTISKSLVDASRQHPMALWMMAGQSANERFNLAPWSLIGDKWQGRMAAYVGKVRAIQPAGSQINGLALDMLTALEAKPDDATRSALWARARAAMGAAEKSCGTAPETAAAGFLLAHAVRLSAQAGRPDEALAGLQAVPFKPARAYSMGAVHALAQYLAAQDMAEEARMLRDQLITPELVSGLAKDELGLDSDRLSGLLALIAEDEAAWKQAVLMRSDPASDVMFNFLSAKTLWAFSADPAFKAADRALFARAAWTREYGLVRRVDGEKLAALHELNPEIKAIWEKVKADYPDISPRNQRLLTILRSPAHNILVAMPGGWSPESIKPESFTEIDGWNPNDKNWWCPFEPDRQLLALRAQADETLGMPDDGDVTGRLADVYDPAMREGLNEKRDRLLKAHPMIRAANWKELRALAQMDQAPKRLTESAIRWARNSRGQDGAAEALALAVRTTRFGCNWHGGHEKYSKAAQQMLVRKFEATEWQKQTPYWFNCRRTEWNADMSEKTTTCEPKSWPGQAPLN